MGAKERHRRRPHRLVSGPIRATTTAIAVVVVAVAVLLAALLLVLAVRTRLESNERSIVISRAQDIVALVNENRLPRVLAFTGEDAALIQVVDQNGVVVASTPNITGRPPITALRPVNDSPRLFTLRTLPVDRGQRFAVVAMTGRNSDGSFVVYTAISLDAADQGVRTLTISLLGGVPVLVLLVGLTTWFLTGNVLEPVEQIRAEVDEITANRLHRRVPVSRAGDEVSRLARTMNDMLDRLERAAERQQRFVADASHELRSPLAVMRTTIEVNLAHPERADWVATSKDLLVDHERVERIVQDLLVLARQGEAALRPQVLLNLSGVVESEIARRAGSPVQIHVDVEPDVMVVGDHDHLAQVLRNLVDNAQRYARRRINVRVRRVGGEAVLDVIDDGRGIDPSDRERVFERFARLDNEENRHHEGSGLGLAIVEELVRAHHGTVQVVDDPRGAHFEIRLPAVDAV